MNTDLQKMTITEIWALQAGKIVNKDAVKNGWKAELLRIPTSAPAYVTYDGKFVARYKYSHLLRIMRVHLRYLVRNFTPEEYFAQLDAGKSPIEIMESKGKDMPTPCDVF